MTRPTPRRAVPRGPAVTAALLALTACGAPQPGPDASNPDGATRDATNPAPDTGVRDDAPAPPNDTTPPPPDATMDAPSPPPDASPDVPAPPTGMPFVYVGTGAGPISVLSMNAATGALSPRYTTMVGGNPSFLAFEPRANPRFAWAVQESANAVLSFAIDPSTAALTQLSRVMSEGNGPAHVAVDPTGRWVFAANYGGGTVAVWPVGTGGRLGAVADRESPGTNPHQVVIDPTSRYAFVPCLGSNYVAQFVFDVSTGQLNPNAVPHMMTAAGAGPRHLALHPAGGYAYLINETNSTMTALRFDSANGTLAPIQTVSTLPAGFTGTNTGAEVAVAPSGRFVYGSNRGHNSIVIFAVDAASGMLTLVGHQSTSGMTPRHFSIDPTGAFLLVANQGSDDVVTFRIDTAAGTLTRLGVTSVPVGPAFVGAVFLPGP